VKTVKRRDYYVVLGVERGEPAEGIRRAFHELALRYHPDRAGEGATALFQELVEAYRVLSDGRTRAAYDRALKHAEAASGKAAPPAAIPVPFSPRSDVPEPLAAWGLAGARAAPLDAWFQRNPRHQTALATRKQNALRNVWVNPPDMDQMLERVRQSLRRKRPPEGEALEPLVVELILTEEQAAVGGGLTLEVPVFFPCETCRGAGERDGGKCPACGGATVLPEPRPLTVPIPPGVEDGGELELQLRGLGLHSLYLRVRAWVLRGGPRAS
jgi:curved DNA-binding protein CbpA